MVITLQEVTKVSNNTSSVAVSVFKKTPEALTGVRLKAFTEDTLLNHV